MTSGIDLDLAQFLKEREKFLIHHTWGSPPPDHEHLDTWIAGLLRRLEEVDAVEGTPTARFGKAFHLKRVAGHRLVAVYLADFEWAVQFIMLLRDVQSILTRVPRHLLLRYSFCHTARYIMLLLKNAATAAKWSFTPETNADWHCVQEQLRELTGGRDEWPKFREASDRAEIEAMTKKHMLRCGVIDSRRFYAIQAGPLDAVRWETWLASGPLNGSEQPATVSPTLKIADNIEDLKRWASRLPDHQIRRIVDRSLVDNGHAAP